MNWVPVLHLKIQFTTEAGQVPPNWNNVPSPDAILVCTRLALADGI